MFNEENYRFCTRLSLQILHDQRKRICQDSIQKDVDLYTALHELKPNVRDIRFQYYLVKWFDGHWRNLRELLERHSEYTVDEKKRITLFFAKYFANLLDSLSKSETMVNLAIPDLLKVRKNILYELVEMTEKWETNSKELFLQMKKHEEQYRSMVETYNKQSKENVTWD